MAMRRAGCGKEAVRESGVVSGRGRRLEGWSVGLLGNRRVWSSGEWRVENTQESMR